MSTPYMLDTDTVSYALLGKGKVGVTMLRHHRSVLCLSAIAAAQLQFGAERSGSPKLREQVDAFTRGIRVAPFDAPAAKAFGSLRTTLARAGTPIGDLDTLLAAHALSLGAIFVTNNVRHFSRVPNLTIENWL